MATLEQQLALPAEPAAVHHPSCPPRPPRAAGLDIDALRDVSAAVNGLKSQRPDMGILMVTHYKVQRNRIRGQKSGRRDPAVWLPQLTLACDVKLLPQYHSEQRPPCTTHLPSLSCAPPGLQRLLDYIRPDQVHIMQVRSKGCVLRGPRLPLVARG